LVDDLGRDRRDAFRVFQHVLHHPCAGGDFVRSRRMRGRPDDDQHLRLRRVCRGCASRVRPGEQRSQKKKADDHERDSPSGFHDGFPFS